MCRPARPESSMICSTVWPSGLSAPITVSTPCGENVQRPVPGTHLHFAVLTGLRLGRVTAQSLVEGDVQVVGAAGAAMISEKLGEHCTVPVGVQNAFHDRVIAADPVNIGQRYRSGRYSHRPGCHVRARRSGADCPGPRSPGPDRSAAAGERRWQTCQMPNFRATRSAASGPYLSSSPPRYDTEKTQAG